MRKPRATIHSCHNRHELQKSNLTQRMPPHYITADPCTHTYTTCWKRITHKQWEICFAFLILIRPYPSLIHHFSIVLPPPLKPINLFISLNHLYHAQGQHPDPIMISKLECLQSEVSGAGFLITPLPVSSVIKLVHTSQQISRSRSIQ